MRIKEDIEYREGLFVDLYLPDSEQFDLFVYFHGGGLKSGSRKGVEVFASTLAKKNIATASVEYRMYPTAKFPDFIEDCAAAVSHLIRNRESYGNFREIYLGGSSAGGYISMMLCFDQRYLEGQGVSAHEISGYVHDAGQPTSHFNVLSELGRDSRRLIVDETAPLYFVGTRESYPPMVFIVSDNDLFGRYEQTLLTVKTLEHFGHKETVFLEVMHGVHCEYNYKADGNGEGVFGLLVSKYVEKMKQLSHPAKE